ncbi:hypothetical protein ABT095_37915 [Kitasatospora sp. NPDC002227]|uniref:hypothetical protein n=1 Tax=Kitasatospora sp. NPDC002227 TaxID=3154773 RepID=UPI00333113ED
MLSHRSLSTLALGLLLTVSVTACTGADKPSAAPATATPTVSATPALADLSGEEILKQATAALSQNSFTVEGDLSGGEDGAMRVTLSTDGKGSCTGTIQQGATGSFELRATPDRTWLKPDAQYWASILAKKGVSADVAAAVTERIGGKYLTGPQDDPDVKGMAEICKGVTGILSDFGNAKVTKAAVRVAEGVETVPLTVTTADGSSGQVYIAATGKPYPVKMESPMDTQPVHVVFRDFGKPVTVQAPPAAQVLDTADLKKQTQGA